MRATNINMMAIILREEDWDCAALPLGVLRGADAAEEGRFSRCRSLLLSLWGGKQRFEKGGKRGGREKERSKHDIHMEGCYSISCGSIYPQLVVL